MIFFKQKQIVVSATAEEIEKTLWRLNAYKRWGKVSPDMFSIRIPGGSPSSFRTAVCALFRGKIKETGENTFEISYEIRPAAISWCLLTLLAAAMMSAFAYLIRYGMSDIWAYCVLGIVLMGVLTVAGSVSQAEASERRFTRALKRNNETEEQDSGWKFSPFALVVGLLAISLYLIFVLSLR